jgi:hypothetical protein
MNSLDIFQKLPGGTRLWICGAGSVLEAKMRLLDLQRAEPAEYYACDLAERAVVVAITRERPELHTVTDDTEFFGKLESRYRETTWHRTRVLRDRSVSERQFGWGPAR